MEENDSILLDFSFNSSMNATISLPNSSVISSNSSKKRSSKFKKMNKNEQFLAEIQNEILDDQKFYTEKLGKPLTEAFNLMSLIIQSYNDEEVDSEELVDEIYDDVTLVKGEADDSFDNDFDNNTTFSAKNVNKVDKAMTVCGTKRAKFDGFGIRHSAKPLFSMKKAFNNFKANSNSSNFLEKFKVKLQETGDYILVSNDQNLENDLLFGMIIFQNSDLYIGQLHRTTSLPQGKGILLKADSSTYKGEFFEGKFEGQGSLESHAGFTYNGKFKKNKFHGKGEYYCKKRRERLKGTFNKGRFDGLFTVYYYNRDKSLIKKAKAKFVKGTQVRLD
jgi:hypothetical protein